jgi:hypothetical protein
MKLVTHLLRDSHFRREYARMYATATELGGTITCCGLRAPFSKPGLPCHSKSLLIASIYNTHLSPMRPIPMLKALALLAIIVGVRAPDNRLLYTIPKNETTDTFRTWYVL